LLETKEAKMKLRIFGQRIKVNGKAIEKSSKNYIVNGNLYQLRKNPVLPTHPVRKTIKIQVVRAHRLILHQPRIRMKSGVWFGAMSLTVLK